MYKKFIFLMLLILSITVHSNYCLAQSPVYKQFNTSNGMAGNTIYSILYDDEGYIWLGTDYGVSKFDGKDFVNYTLTNGLSDIQILKIKQDSKGRIWFLGFNGTISYWSKGKIYNASNDSTLKEIVSENSFREFYEDEEHDLWFSSLVETFIYKYPKIIYKYPNFPTFVMKSSKGYISNIEGSVVLIDKTNKQNNPITLKYKAIKSAAFFQLAANKAFFIAAEGIVYQFDTIQKLMIPLNKTFNNVRISNMLITKDSLLLLSAIGKGLYCYDLKSTKKKPVIYLKNKLVNDVTTDKEGNIWATTLDEGIFMIPNYSNKVVLYNQESGLSDAKILALSKQKNELLIGVFPNKLFTFNGKQIKSMPVAVEQTSNKIIQIKSNEQNIWISLEQGLIKKNKKSIKYIYEKHGGKNHKIVNAKDMSIGKTRLNMATSNGLFTYLVTENKIATRISPATHRIFSTYEDYKGTIWYGAISGLQSFSNNKINYHASENKLLSNRINSIAETADSTLILATNGYGILFYKNGKILFNITDKNGLSNNICKKVLVFGKSIYAVTNNGISILKYIDGKINDIKILNTNNYLHTNEINDLVVDSNYVYVATNSGLLTIKKDILNSIIIKKPTFYITEFSVNDSLLPQELNSKLPFNKNNIRIKYIGIYYQQPNAVVYRYRLKSDQEWKLTNKNILEFPFLEPDNYNFEIQTKIFNGNWTASKFLHFEIKFPFYRQTWFIILLVICCVLVIVFIYHFQIKKAKKKQAEKAGIENIITNLKQQALQSLMNPHFIFNVMNSLQQFINVNNKESANKYLSDFAKLIRLNLDISSKQFISIDDELSYLKLYLSFEQLRFGDNLKYNFFIDPNIDIYDSFIPVMMIQPFVENAIWHGILPTQSEGKISLNIIQLAPELIKVTVEDNGIGIKKEYLTPKNDEIHTNNHALSMTEQRLKLISKTTNHKLTICFKNKYPDEEMKGTIAEILLPIS